MQQFVIIQREVLVSFARKAGVLVGVLLLLSALSVSAQSKKELQSSKKNLQKEILETNRLLEQTKKSKKVSLNELVILKKKISTRKRLINSIYIDVQKLEKEIVQNKEEVIQLENELTGLKLEYEKMVKYAYRNRNKMNNLMLILSSDGIFQAYKRIRYLQQYSDYQKLQAQMIVHTKEAITNKIIELDLQKKEKQALLAQHENEKNTLAQEKEQQNEVYAQLKKKERELQRQKKAKEAELAELDAAIKRIIAEEIRLQKLKNKNKDASGAYKLTPEEKVLSADFKGNMGKLPWPLERGVVTSRFGKHQHPVLKGIEVDNSGIDIGTTKGAIARAVFKGKVTGVVDILGRKAVIVRHGEYLSVYSNLLKVYVSKGQEVDTKELLGLVATDKNDGKTELHFEIRQGNIPLNPSFWLSR